MRSRFVLVGWLVGFGLLVVGFRGLVLVGWFWLVDFILLRVRWFWGVGFGELVLEGWFWWVGFDWLVLFGWFELVEFGGFV